MKKVAIWGTAFVVFVIIRIILGEVGVYSPGERVGGFLDIFIFLILLGLFQFVYGFVFKDKKKDKTDSEERPPIE